ncbi:right-handed parallel beta-helix repeat-containing protein [uncultured Aquimarina sp.]|uniref:right-handed parallel beta-helix repeat-containing protein n=1 Tax=uncultured Aquimarina sp. TaxID=575652 RepID=UPI00260F615A|nr:right-handed parallel beta-helix repeat-containing protein [uncultured Aquimarina sp.]
MKKVPYFLLLIFALYVTSCSTENFDDITQEVSDEDPDTTDPDTDDPDEDVNTSDTPCDFDLFDIAANSTVVIDCILDLEGETINLPDGVILTFDGGDIIGDGILNFSGGGKIAGELLSSKVTLLGDVTLIDPIFKFVASRWKNIKQGQTTSDIALKNNTELEKLFFDIKEMGGTTFEMGKFDAYFETTKVTSTTTNQNFYASSEAVNLPSDFHLKLSSETVLRQFPAESGVENGTILAVRDVSNVTISGPGTLMGDRDDRIYSPGDIGLEGTHLLHIHASRNITIDGVNFVEGSKGAIHIYSLGFSFNPDYIPTRTVKVLNCKFTDIRRMSIALTDGSDILIEGNTFKNIGQPSANSDGGEVGHAINIEAYRRRDDNGNLLEYEKAYDITIRKNKEENSRVGFATVHIGQDVTIEENEISTNISYTLASKVRIINNKLTAQNSDENYGILATGEGETVFSNEVSNNSISGYNIGISVNTKDLIVNNNIISNCEGGIQLIKAINVKLNNNTIQAKNNGIIAVNTYADNITFKGNSITSDGFHVKLSGVNQNTTESGYRITFDDNNEFFNNRQVSFYNTNGVVFKNNIVNGGIEIGNSSNIEIGEASSAQTTNEIYPSESDGIRIYGDQNNVSIFNNAINEPTGAERFQCINNNANNPNAVTIANNICNQ